MMGISINGPRQAFHWCKIKIHIVNSPLKIRLQTSRQNDLTVVCDYTVTVADTNM